MKCLNLSDVKIRSLIDKYTETTISKAIDKWESLGKEGFPTDKFIDDFNKLQNKSNIPNHVYSPDVLLDLNRTLSFFILDKINTIGQLKIKDIEGGNLRLFIANELQSLLDNEGIKEDKKELVQNLVDDIKANRNNVFKNFTKYLDYIFGLKLPNAYEDFISNNELGEIPEDWDNNKLFRDPKESTPTKVKLKFANIIDESKDSAIGTIAGTPIDINDVYNVLLLHHQNDDTNEEILTTLDRLSKDISPIYNDIKQLLVDSIDRDDDLKNDFLNAYRQIIGFRVQKDKILSMKTSGKQIKVGTLVSNRDSFPEFALWDKLQNEITSKIENGLFNINSQLLTKQYNEGKELDYVYNSLLELGIPISKSYLDNIYDLHKQSIINGNSDTTFNNILTSLNYISNSINSDLKNRKVKTFNSKGDLFDLINTIKNGLLLLPDYSYMNVSGKMQQSAQQICYVTNMFKQFNSSNNDAIMKRFGHFTKVPQMIYSNWLWKQYKGDINGIFKPIFNIDGSPRLFGFDSNGNETTKNVVYFNYKIDKNAISNDGLTGIDLDYINSFDVALYSGQKNITHNEGKEYTDLLGYGWDLHTISNYLISDNRYNMMLPASDAGRTYGLMSPKHNVTANLKFDNNIFTIELSENTQKKIRYSLFQELEEMFVVRDTIFDQKEFNKGVFKEGANIDKYKLHSVKHGSYDKGKNNFILVKDNRPIGKVFDPSNLTYVDNGKVITLKSYLSEYGYDLPTISRNHLKDPNFINIVDKFIDTAINNKINNFLKYTEPLRSTLFLLRNTNGKEIFKGDNKQAQLNTKLAEFYIDHYLNFVEFGNFIYGNASEYNGVLDWNKRVNQAIRPGLQHFSNENTKQITVNDIKLSSKIPSLMQGILSPKILEQYNNDVNVADGFSVITLPEYKRRLIASGRYEEYKQIIDILESGKQLNITQQNKFIESQKYFSYSRQYNNSNGIPTLISYQFKNSSMVLVPSFIKGTEWEQVNNFLNNIGADQMNFDSATKLGGVHTLTIHDKEGNFKLPDIEIAKSIITEHPLSQLYIQQDIPSHIIDSDNKAGVQLMKLIITNLDHTNKTTYNINGQFKTGKEIASLWHDLNSNNIDDSANLLLRSVDALDENGNIKYDSNGNILCNKAKILELIKEHEKSSTDNINILSSLEDNINDSNIPFFASVNTSKFIQIVLAKFTKDIVDQKLPGMSLVLVPDIFHKPSNEFLKTHTMEDFFNTTNYSFTNSFKQRCIKDNKFELKPITEYDEKGNAKYGYEAIINPFLSELVSENGIIDINQLSEEALDMIGIRIPTEGKQSTVFIRVVGFINSGASQIVLPYDLVNTTGWDFDIDKLFVYHKHLENKNGIFIPIDNFNSSNENKYINFIKDRIKNISYFDIINKVSDTQLSNIVNLINRNNEPVLLSDNRTVIANKLEDLVNKLTNNNSLNIPKTNNLYSFIFELKKLVDTKTQLSKNNLSLRAQAQDFDRILTDFNNSIFRQQDSIDNFNIAKNIAQIHNIENFDLFKSKDNIYKLDRETRDNHIIEIMKSIMRNKYHANEAFKQNEMNNVQNASSYVNNKAGFNVSSFNQNDYTENSKLRTLNVQTRNLKGISVATDGLINILSVINAHFDGRSVPEVKIHESHINNQSELKEIFGKLLIPENGYYYINDAFIGNNFSGTWKDISGLSHSVQMSEITTNILDAVKKLMFFNFDHNTIGIFKTMSMGSLLHKDRITGKGNNEYNRFLYPILFLSQPIISDYIKTINLAITYDASPKVIDNKVLGEYYRKFYDSLRTTVKARIPLSINDKGIVTEWSDYQDIIGYQEPNKGNSLINEILNKLFTKDKSKLISDINKNEPIKINNKNNIHREFYEILKQALNIDNKYQSLEELNNNFVNYYKNNELFTSPNEISNQIELYDTFKKYKTLSTSITKAVNTLNVDKKSIGPSPIISKKLFNNIRNSIFTPSELRKELYKIQDDLEEQGIYDLDNSIINNFIRRYTSEGNIEDQYSVIKDINEFLSPYGHDIEDPSTIIKVGKKSLYKSVFPIAFKSNEKSSYPILQSYLWSGHRNALDLLTGINLFETEFAREIKSIIFETLSNSDNEYLDKEINHSLLRSYANELPYFKNNEDEIPRLFGINKSNIDLKSIDINNIDNLDSNLEKFNTLSLCDKIMLIRNDKTMLDYIRNPRFKNAHILDHIVLKNNQEIVEKIGYETLEYSNTDSNQNMQIFSILDMYYNTNPYLSSIANDIVKYSFFNDGFKFGNNLAKVIPSQLYYYTPEETKFINDTALKISNKEQVSKEDLDRFSLLTFDSSKAYADLMRDKLVETNTNLKYTANQEKILKQIRAFYQQNSKNSSIVPRIFTENKEDNQGVRNERYDNSLFKMTNINEGELLNGISNNKNYTFFVVPFSKIENSKYAKNDYVQYDDNGRTRLFTRTLETIQRGKKKENIYVYYPINRTLKGEFLNTNIESFKENDEQDYLRLISQLNTSHKLDSILSGTFNDTSSFNAKVRELYNTNSDYINLLLPELNFDEDGKTIDQIIGDKRPIINTYVEYYDQYNRDYSADKITIYDDLKEGNFTSKYKQFVFELAKAEDKDIYVKDEKTNIIYHYQNNQLSEFDNSSPLSNRIEDILYYLVNKYNNEGKLGLTSDGRISRVRANNMLKTLDQVIIPRLNGDSIITYINNNKDELLSDFPQFKQIFDTILSLKDTEFFNDLNKLVNKDSTSNLNIKYSKTLTTISNKSTTHDTAKALQLLSDVVLNIGNTNSIEYNAIKNSNNLIHVDFNKPITNSLNSIKELTNKSKLSSITLGIIGEEDNKPQEFYNEYVHTLLNKISNITDKSIVVVTLNKSGVYQAALIPDNHAILVLDNQNKFDKKPDNNIKYSKSLQNDILEEAEIEDIKIDSKISDTTKTIKAIEQGLMNVSNIKKLLWKVGGSIYEQYNSISNQITSRHGLLDNLAKQENIKSVKAGTKHLVKSALEAKKYILKANKELSEIDFSTIYEAGNASKRMNISNNLSVIGTLYKSLKYIDNLVEYEIPEDLSIEMKQDLFTINQDIITLKSYKDDIDKLYDKSRSLVDKFILQRVYSKSTNPNFKTELNELKNKLQAYIHNEGYNYTVTDQDIYDNYLKLYQGEDITWTMKMFDSPAQTGITVSDVSLLEYYDQFKDLLLKRAKYNDELYLLTEKMYGKDSTNAKAHNKRLSFEKLLDGNQLISNIKWFDFNKSYYDNQQEIIGLQIEHDLTDDTTKKAQIEQQIMNLQYTWLANNIEGINITKDNNGNITSVNIDPNIKLNETEQAELDSKYETYSYDNRFRRYLSITHTHKLNTKYISSKEADYIKLKPKESLYKNNKFDSLTNEEHEFVNSLRTLLNKINSENATELELSNDFFPKLLPPSLRNTLVQDIIGFKKITPIEDITTPGVNNEILYKIEAPNIEDFEYYHEFNIPTKYYKEKAEDYEKRALKAINDWYRNKANKEQKAFIKEKIGDEFKSLRDVYKYNRFVREYNSTETAKNMVKDPYLAIKSYIDSITNHKLISDFYSYSMMLQTALSENLKLKNYEGIQDYLKTKISGNRENRTINFDESNLKEVLETNVRNVIGVSNVNTITDQVLNSIYRGTGLTYMALGVMNAIKNVGTGYNMIITEALSNQFFNYKDLASATKEYSESVWHTLASTGSDYSSNLTTALMKSAPTVFEDRSEKGHLQNYPNLAGKLKWAYDSAYFMNNAGDHFMQYSTYLASLKSHKIFEGKIFSKHEFVDGNVRRGLQSLLSEDEQNKLDAYINTRKKTQKHEIEEHSYISEWVYLHQDELKDRYKRIIKKIDELNKESQKVYEELPNIYSQYELQNGRAVLKKDSLINQDEVTRFERRVQVINFYLQGIYNQFDKAKIRDTMWGTALMQFRQWMRPTFERYWGTKGNILNPRPVYNEGLGIYQKGAYNTLFQLLFVPLKNRKHLNDEGEYIKKGFANLMKDYFRYLKHLKFHYNLMDENSQAKVRIALTNFSQIAMLTFATFALLKFAGDDDEDQKQTIRDSRALALLLYFNYSINSELNQMLPTQLFSTLQKTQQNIAATESTIKDLIEFTGTLISYPFMDENESTYDRGIYKDESKLKIQFEKVFPIARQINKLQYVQNYMDWYKQYALKWY